MPATLSTLKGCSPAPLANYLKALGILRLISEQADPLARGWWQDEHFCLLTTLTKTDIEQFFLVEYQPTPMLSPWNKGCGFFKANDPGLAPLEASVAPRFKTFRDGTAVARQLLDEIGHADAFIRSIKSCTKTTSKGYRTEKQRTLIADDYLYRRSLAELRTRLTLANNGSIEQQQLQTDLNLLESLSRVSAGLPTTTDSNAIKTNSAFKALLASAERRFKHRKAALIPDCRRIWRRETAEWLSAAVVLDEKGDPTWPSLLGTGGNDGNLDFTNNFMQQLCSLFDITTTNGDPSQPSHGLLKNALWADPTNGLTSAAIGQFQPGSAGGANSSTGFLSGNLVNAWDFVLMMEGTILFSAVATKLLTPTASNQASVPFATRAHAAGIAAAGSEKAQRGEQWMPIWQCPTTLGELSSIFAEARVQLYRRPVHRPIDVARAIGRLGVARGIESFVRYGYLERNGQSTLAVPLGRIPVRQNRYGHLIDDLSAWIDRIQRRSREKNSAARLQHIEHALADAIFSALTHDPSPDRWQAVLLAAAEVESLQAAGTGFEAGPIPSLTPEWIVATADNTAEFRLAVALGGAASRYSHEGFPIDSVRHHFLPLEPTAKRFRISDKRLVNDSRVVASCRDSLRDLIAIVERRLVESAQTGQRRSRLVAANGCGARLDDLADFIRGNLDLPRLLGLARAFMAIRWDRWSPADLPQTAPRADTPDECWLSLRLCCLAWPLSKGYDIPAEERCPRLLRSGESARAIAIARQRLLSAGIRPPMYVGTADSDTARRWAAALVFPIHRGTARRVAALVDPSMKGLIHA